MLQSNTRTEPLLTPEQRQVYDQFAQRLEAGEQPSLTELLAEASESDWEGLFPALLRLELAHRRGRNLPLDEDQYRGRFPGREVVISAVFAAISTPGGGFDTTSEPASTVDPLPIRGGIEAQLQLGAFLGRFELQQRLGSGGFGEVYRARDHRLDRYVALKVPRPGTLGTDESAERFLREARAAAQLHHPHIVPVHEAAREGDTCYIASEYIAGHTLRDVLKGGQQLVLRESVELVAKLADALDYAHGKGIIHRDIKPENILIDDAGEPHLLDFGLARRLEGESLRTVAGDLLGTPAYMSPEQARGEGYLADGRTDVWSLGVVLYELVTGQRPFAGPALEVMQAILHHEPNRLRQIDPALPRDLETIVARCLHKERERRFASCEQVADELRRWLRGDPVLSRPISPVEQTWRWCRKHRTIAALSAAVILTLVAGTAIASFFALDARVQSAKFKVAKSVADTKSKAAQASAQLATSSAKLAELKATEAEDRRQEAERQTKLAVAAQRESDAGRYFATMQLTHDAIRRSNLNSAYNYQRQFATKNPEQDLRGPEWYFLQERVTRGRHSFYGSGGLWICGPSAISPSGSRLAVATRAGTIAMFKVAQERVQTLLPDLKLKDSTPCFATDDDTLIVAAKQNKRQGLFVFSVAQSRCIQEHFESFEFSGRPCISGDHRWIAAPAGDRVVLYSTNPLARQTEVALDPGELVVKCRLSATGDRLAIATQEGRLKVWDAVTQTVVFDVAASPLRSVDRKVGGLAISADNRLLACGFMQPQTLDSPGLMDVWDIESGQLVSQLAAREGECSAAQFMHNSRVLVTGGVHGSVQFWDLSGPPETWPEYPIGTSVAMYGSSMSLEVSLEVSPDDSLVIVSTPFDHQTVALPIYRQIDVFRGVEPSPDGRIVAGISPQGDQVIITDLMTGLRRRLAGQLNSPQALLYSANGDRLIVVEGLPDEPTTLRVWNLLTGNPLPSLTLSCHCRAARSVPTTSHMIVLDPGVAAGKSLDAIYVDVATNQVIADPNTELRRWRGDGTFLGRRIVSQANSADGRTFAIQATEGEGVASVYVLPPMSPPRQLVDSQMSEAIALSPDGGRLGLFQRTKPSGAYVWDTFTGEQIAFKKSGYQGSLNIALVDAQEGRTFFSEGPLIFAMSTRDGKELGQLQGHHDLPDHFAVSPDGSRLASVALGRKIFLWDTHRLRLACILDIPFHFISELRFSSDGKLLLVRDRARTSVAVWRYGDRATVARGQGNPSRVKSTHPWPPLPDVASLQPCRLPPLPVLQASPLVTPLSPPRLIAPRQGETMGETNRGDLVVVDWQFDWEDVPGASAYEFTLSHARRNGRNALRVQDTSLAFSDFRHFVSGTHYEDGTARWKVRAKVGGAWQSWSEERSFEVVGLPDVDHAKAVFGPANDPKHVPSRPPGSPRSEGKLPYIVVEVPPRQRFPREMDALPGGRPNSQTSYEWSFDWDELPLTDEYHLRAQADGTVVPAISESGIRSSEYRHIFRNGFTPPSNWNWQVRAKIMGQWQEWSPRQRFQVVESPIKPPAIDDAQDGSESP